jgi:hypothetical protein
MQDIIRVKIVSGVDIIIAILLLIAGIFITIVGMDYLNMVSMYSSYSSYSSYNPFTTYAIPWTAIIFGIATIVYGIKRALDDVLKMMTDSK